MSAYRLNTCLSRLVQRLQDSTRPGKRRLVNLLAALQLPVDEAPATLVTDAAEIEGSLEYRIVNACTQFQKWAAVTCLGECTSCTVRRRRFCDSAGNGRRLA